MKTTSTAVAIILALALGSVGLVACGDGATPGDAEPAAAPAAPAARPATAKPAASKPAAARAAKARGCCSIFDAELGRQTYTTIATEADCTDLGGEIETMDRCDAARATAATATPKLCCASTDTDGSEAFDVVAVSVDCEERGGKVVSMGQCDDAR